MITAGVLKPVVVTRAEPSDGPLTCELRDLGLQVLSWPTVRVQDTKSERLDELLRRLEEFDWIVFASRPAVLAATERRTSPPEGVQIAAVGAATAQLLRQRGWPVDLLPATANAAALVQAFASLGQSGHLGGRRILYPASSRALPTIATGLSQLGAEVTQVEAYRTDSSALDVDECRSWIERRGVGAVTFASPSAVVELARALGQADFARLLASAAAVAIGPTTARALIGLGFTPRVAESATLHALAVATFRSLHMRH
jgi:uroporphyrinogen-III synthase